MTLPANKFANIRRRVNRARSFPHNTCPASRHAVQIAERIARGQAVDPQEREGIAVSLMATVEALWKLRTKVAKGEPK